jgi:hypothetical protein
MLGLGVERGAIESLTPLADIADMFERTQNSDPEYTDTATNDSQDNSIPLGQTGGGISCYY